MAPSRRLRILAEPAFKNRATNPYQAALYDQVLAMGHDVSEYTTKSLLRGKWDILHLHWPENRFVASRWRSWIRTRLLLLRLWLARRRGVRVVWSVHNVAQHDGDEGWVERSFWRRFVRGVDLAVHLSEAGRRAARHRFPALEGIPDAVVPHGHYRGLYPDDVDRDEARRRLGVADAGRVVAFLGQVKPYKNVEALIEAFGSVAAPDDRLIIAGAAAPDMARRLEAARGEGRILLDLEHIGPERVQEVLRAADLAVLPFRDILHSGSAFLALSFDVPVLAPRVGALPELQEAVGAQWMRLYDDGFDGDALREALHQERPQGRPDLDAFSWEHLAQMTLDAYGRVTDA